MFKVCGIIEISKSEFICSAAGSNKQNQKN